MSPRLLVNAIVAVSPCSLAVPHLVLFLFGWLVVALPLLHGIPAWMSHCQLLLLACVVVAVPASSPCRLAVCWLFAFAGIEVAIQFVDAGIAGRQFSLGVIKLVICMALIG
ncbi:hypothetical protein D5086_014924 [Populus alba]|uniref:Uncharacterized protein n=1 Tax=Populus alba TaxID=43335 RepID=A0ACC4C1S0_POPAL